jgi:hypothetical protein
MARKPVSTEMEVFRKCFRSFPVRSGKLWLQYPLVNPEESIAVMGMLSSLELNNLTFFEREPEVQGFFPAEKFLEHCEMRY